MFAAIASFTDFSSYVEENIVFLPENLNLNFTSFSYDLYVFSTYTYDILLSNSNPSSSFIISYIDQLEDMNTHNNIENITSIYHYSIPNTKLSYPEPFIASPSFMHSDL
jgi:hypothetical protein